MKPSKPIKFKVDPLTVACTNCGQAAGQRCLRRNKLNNTFLWHPVRFQRAAQDQCPRVSVYVSGDDIRVDEGDVTGLFVEGWYDHALLEVDYARHRVEAMLYWNPHHAAQGVLPRLVGIHIVRGVDVISLLGRLVDDDDE